MIFTDEDGNKYELVPVQKTDHEILTLKPIKPIEKKEYVLLFREFTDVHDDDLINKRYKLTEPQSGAISEAIKALMEYIQTPIKRLSDSGVPQGGTGYREDGGNFVYFADEARKKLMENE